MQSDCLSCLETKTYFVIFYNKSTICVSDVTFEFEFYYDSMADCYSLPSSHLILTGTKLKSLAANFCLYSFYFPAILITSVLLTCALFIGFLKYGNCNCQLIRRAVSPEIVGYSHRSRQPFPMEMTVYQPTTTPFESDLNLQTNEHENRVPTASSWGSDFDDCSFSDTSV